MPWCMASNSRRATVFESGLTTKTWPSGATASGLERVGCAAAAAGERQHDRITSGAIEFLTRTPPPGGGLNQAVQQAVTHRGGALGERRGCERIALPDALQQGKHLEVVERQAGDVHQDVHGVAGAEDALVHVALDLGCAGGEERAEVVAGELGDVRTAVHDLARQHAQRGQVRGREVGDALHRLGQSDGTRIGAELLVDAHHPADHALENRPVDRLFASEVVEQHPLGDAGPLRDLPGGRRAVAALGEHAPRRRRGCAAARQRRGPGRERRRAGSRVRTDRYVGLYSWPARAVKGKPPTRRGGPAGLGAATPRLRLGSARRARLRLAGQCGRRAAPALPAAARHPPDPPNATRSPLSTRDGVSGRSTSSARASRRRCPADRDSCWAGSDTPAGRGWSCRRGVGE